MPPRHNSDRILDFEWNLYDFWREQQLADSSLVKFKCHYGYRTLQLSSSHVGLAQGHEFEIMTEMWPVLQGQERAEIAYAQALNTGVSPPSVDIVTSRRIWHGG